ncbi:hypothetical protein KL86PLE_90491 [uncultured Pleomorphomonas sp.]|uniref:Uncharacterized protein n=1 Tax=uncultured Pleomorphomonas sp. TaxID=442121 RepID=A0A212LPX5_9HYPH|nr:hypothetical protein KL86PLE_90491 [uncultured Pleomorphomonas sp.]
MQVITTALIRKHRPMKTFSDPTKLSENSEGNHQQFIKTKNRVKLTNFKVILHSRS